MDALNNCAGTVHRQRADAEELRAAEELGEERAKQEMQLRTAEDRLPSTFIGGPRYMGTHFQQAMMYARVYGKPDMLQTYTSKPTWPKITAELPLARNSHLFPWIATRAFFCKLEKLKEDLFKKHVLGRIEAYTYVIEFPKRGLPRAHMLLIARTGTFWLTMS
jgi:hypothetical protein